MDRRALPTPLHTPALKVATRPKSSSAPGTEALHITMPSTPFHIGAAMLIKPAATTRFSLIAFGLAQIIIDIEPGIDMLRGSPVLHGASLTVIGALFTAG